MLLLLLLLLPQRRCQLLPPATACCRCRRPWPPQLPLPYVCAFHFEAFLRATATTSLFPAVERVIRPPAQGLLHKPQKGR
jgi:hypothetical protein